MANIVELILKGTDRQGASTLRRGVADLQKMRTAMSGLARAAAGMGVAVGGALAALTIKTINNADAMGKLSQATGFSVKEFSQLAFAASKGSVELNELRVALSTLMRNISLAADQTSAQAQLFRAMGISVVDASGNVRDARAIFDDLANAFSRYEDGANKTAIAMKLMGESGARMIPVLNQGADAIRTDGAKFIGFSQEASQQAIRFNDNLADLKVQLSNLGVLIAERVLPFLVAWTNDAKGAAANLELLGRVAIYATETFKVMAFATFGSVQALQALGRIMGLVAQILYTSFQEAIRATVESIRTLGQAISQVGEAARLMFSGHFVDAVKKAKESVANLGTDTANNWKDIFANMAENTKSAWLETTNGIKQDLADVERFRNQLAFGGQPKIGEPNQLQAGQVQGTQLQPAPSIGAVTEAERGAMKERQLLVQSFQDFAVQATNSIASGLGNAFADIVFKTREASEAMKQLGRSILAMVATYIAQRFAAFAIDKALTIAGAAITKTAITTTSAAAGALAGAWAPAATGSLIATLGESSTAALLFPPAVLANTAFAKGIALASSFLGQAHGGLSNVPREGTFLLQQGERVVQQEANADLTRFLATQSGGQTIVLQVDSREMFRWISDGMSDGRLTVPRRAVV